MKGKNSLAVVTALLFFAGAVPGTPQTQRTSGVSADPAWAGLMRSMEHMDAAMMVVPRSGDTDVDFVRLMLPHHQAAIEMAKAELLHGNDPQIRRLAQEVIADQESEIQLMQLWLRQRNLSAEANTALPAED